MLTLGGFLTHPCVQRADPQFVGTPDQLDLPVRWVHSSEIYEIAPLLSGGEVLLTTGLGLAGADPGMRRHWVREVAARDVTAVALEPGRSLAEVPPEMVDEAGRARLALVVLRHVVPFAEISRQVNSDVLSTELAGLRRADRLTRQLHDDAADGAGLEELVGRVSSTTQLPVEVQTLSGQPVAASTPRHGHARRRVGRTARATVRAAGAPWGHVLVGPADDPELQQVADRVAAVVGLVVERSAVAGGTPSRPGATLLDDLVERTDTGPVDLLARAALCGFHPLPQQRVLGVAGVCADPRRAAVLLSRTPGLGPHLVEPVRGQVLGLVAAPPGADPAGLVAQLLHEPARRCGTDVVVGPPVDLGAAGRSLARARAGLAAGAGATGARSWRRTTLPLLLRTVPPDQLELLVEDALGPLLAWDRDHGTDLVGTLATWIEHGLNTSSAARALHVRRQTLHERLARVRSVLGYDPADGRELGHLVAAVAATALPGVRDTRSSPRG